MLPAQTNKAISKRRPSLKKTSLSASHIQTVKDISKGDQRSKDNRTNQFSKEHKEQDQSLTKIPIVKILTILAKEVEKYDTPVAELVKVQTQDPFKILVATIMSSRTNDKTTAKVAKQLFIKINKPQDFHLYSQQQIEQMIYPIGFYKNKARYLKQLPTVLQQRFKGRIPQTIEELLELPGVGRKTANLVVSVAFDKPGICVDVHVHRIVNRIGYIKTKDPLETEMKLRKILPQRYWKRVNRVLVAYGQNLCTPLRPFCSRCKISRYCKKINVKKAR